MRDVVVREGGGRGREVDERCNGEGRGEGGG